MCNCREKRKRRPMTNRELMCCLREIADGQVQRDGVDIMPQPTVKERLQALELISKLTVSDRASDSRVVVIRDNVTDG